MRIRIGELKRVVREAASETQAYMRVAMEIFQDWLDKGGTIESKVDLWFDLHPGSDLDRDKLEDYVYLERDRARAKW